MRADGNIEWLGRMDSQIKIRGFRIEPAEIVAALDLVPEVEASAVVARAERGDEPELVAYVVAADHALPTAPELRVSIQCYTPTGSYKGQFTLLPTL